MKKQILLLLVICVLITGCGSSPEADRPTIAPVGVNTGEQSDDSDRSVQLNNSKVTIEVGVSYQLKAAGASASDVIWTTSNKKVASVSAQGIVKGKKKGTAKITAEVYGKKYTCKVKVKPAKKANNNTVVTYDFRNPSYLTEHYRKHGIEMGFGSEDAYLRAANNVISNPAALHKLEAEDNDHVYYVEATDEIVFLSQDGYIRTYFKCGGRDYFDRQ